MQGLYIGVPVKLSSKGVEEIVQIELTEEEKGMLNHSADAVQELVDVLKL